MYPVLTVGEYPKGQILYGTTKIMLFQVDLWRQFFSAKATGPHTALRK